MATYAIGDVQGCYYSLQDLLKKISFNPSNDQLWFVGDIVNRGRYSLETLTWCYENKRNIQIVLGNHDLHFLAIFFKQRSENEKDTLAKLLNSKKINQLVDWVLSWPLIFSDKKNTLVHAGIHPGWSFENSNELAKEACKLMQLEPEKFFKNMYGNTPLRWSSNLDSKDKMRFTINALTRMRVLNEELELDFNYKGELNNLIPSLKPWFAYKSDFKREKKIISGHWSAIGFYEHQYGVSIDTACIWGKELTALSLDDNKVYSVALNQKDLS